MKTVLRYSGAIAALFFMIAGSFGPEGFIALTAFGLGFVFIGVFVFAVLAGY